MNLFRTQQTALMILFSVVIGVGAFGLFTPATTSAADCPLAFEEPADVFNYAQNETLEFSNFQKQNGQAVITVTNNSDCELPLALSSYEMMSGNNLSEQELHDEQKQVIPANSSRDLKVDLPSCMAQIDLYHDPNEDGVPTPPQPSNAKLIGFTFSGNEKDVFAENDIFHFDEDNPYNNLDDFPNDDDDGFRNAEPAEDSRYCDVPPTTCPYPDNQLPVEEPADIFNYAQDGTLEFSQFQKQNGQAAISITNNSNCEFPVSLGVYEMFDNSFENQELFSQDSTVIESNSQETVSAELPSCMAQIDLLYDPGQNGPPSTPFSANPDLIGFTFNQNEEDIFAENDIFHFDEDNPYNNLDDFPNDDDDGPKDAGPAENFCPAESPTTKLTIIKKVRNTDGRNINPSDFDITATPHTGNGPSFLFNGSSDGETREVNALRYDLSESGPDNVDFTTTYSGDCQARSGSEGGKITPTAGQTSVCTITNRLEDESSENDPVSITCSVSPDETEVNEEVMWGVDSVSGGDGNYSFSWSGDASGSTQTVVNTYSNTGTKEATVTVTDGDGDTDQSQCSMSVNADDNGGGGGSGGGAGGGGAVLDPRDDDEDDDENDGQVRGTQDNFSVQCEPEEESYLIGQNVTFTADVSGDADTEETSFSWDSDTNIDTEDNQASTQYLSAGSKSFVVTAEYNNQEESDTCNVRIQSAQSRGNAVSLDQVPYTGPADTAKTVAFGMLILLIALSGGYVLIRRFGTENTVPIGIPEDGKRE